MGRYKVAERFLSINGEGRRAGQLAYFIRFAGCNLRCEYCDTKWVNQVNTEYFEYDENSLYTMIKGSGANNITLTGGEPLMQENIMDLLRVLRRDETLNIEIETNGSVDIKPFLPDSGVFAEKIYNRAGESFGLTLQDMIEREKKVKFEEEQLADNITFTIDYKLEGSGMEDRMCLTNYEVARDVDTVKFVVGNKADLMRSLEVIRRYRLVEKGCGVYISPIFGRIEPSEIVEFMKDKKLNGVNVQLQMHKYIWSPDTLGV